MIGSSASPVQPTHGSGVVVVEDSPVQRRFLRALIEADPELTVIGEARTGKEALALVERLHPAVVLMDLDLPVMNGIEAIERIMAMQPTPIVVYSAHVGGPDNANGLAALAAGAVDIVAKPGQGDTEDLDAYADGLRRRLRVATRVKVITHPRARLRSGTTPSLPQTAARTALTDSAAGDDRASTPVRPPVRPVDARPVEPLPVRERPLRATASTITAPATVPNTAADPTTKPVDLIAIGVSTGGPQALATLLSALPGDLTQAVLVVQHMADGFLEGLAQWLDSQCALPVGVGEGGKRLQPGTVTLAPGGLNLIVHERLRVTCEVPPPSQFHIPGIDPTFLSIAQHVGPSAIGVILTGMGRDGAAGLKEMREAGATTIGQDEASSAVWGMPGAAKALGAVEYERPLVDIAPLLLSLVTPGARVPR